MRTGDKVCSAMGDGVVVEEGKGFVMVRLSSGPRSGEAVRINTAPPRPAPAPRLAISAPRRTLRSEMAEFDSPLVLGFLAANAVFTAEALGRRKAGVMALYASASGGAPWVESCFSSQSRKWGVELRITFVASERAVAAMGMSGHALPGGRGRFTVNCNDLWLDLVRRGFRMGRDHDIARISEGMDEAQVAQLMDGGGK